MRRDHSLPLVLISCSLACSPGAAADGDGDGDASSETSEDSTSTESGTVEGCESWPGDFLLVNQTVIGGGATGATALLPTPADAAPELFLSAFRGVGDEG